jgi:UDP-GlcNAc:undecaprenyl-phosphate/decaprenyl-phosphate GlcNAc-1-phosphate transferase
VREYLLCLLAAAAVTYVTVPLARTFAIRWGALAEVRDRDVHDRPTPRLGGLAMAAGLLAGLFLASKLPLMSAVFDDGARVPLALLSGAFIIVVLGLIDDRWGLAAPTKLAGQVLAASVMALQGITIIWLPFAGTLVLDPVTSVLLTVLVVLVCINAINMVDGLDGLAAGIVGVAALAFFAYSYLLSVEIGFERATMATLISAVLAGMCLGFLPHNVFPARIFMGDTGSMLLGLLLAAGIITLSGQVDPSAIEGGTLLPALLPILLPLAVMAVPLLDLGLAVVRRTRRGRSPFAPDKQHMHHRLLEVGHSQGRAVLLMYGLAAVIAGTAVALAFVPVGYALIILGVGIAVLSFAVLQPRLSHSRSQSVLSRTGTDE